jgi:uncharacterized membrane protein
MDFEIIKYLIVIVSSMVKFIAGPLIGLASGLNLIETMLTTVMGMMASVLLFSIFGDFLREKVFKKFALTRKLFCTRNRKFIYIRRKYGLVGVSFLTPVILTPIVGALLAATLKGPKSRMFLFMLISATFWSIVLTSAVFYIRDFV